MVIVAIIGLFSTIALTSLSGSRQKGNDAAVKQQLREIQNAAELYALANYNKYGVAATCDEGMFVNEKFDPLFAALDKASLEAEVQCRSTNAGYAVQTALISNPDIYWCVDATGYKGGSEYSELVRPRCPGH